MKETKQIAYFNNIAPHYRKNVWLKMAESGQFDFQFYYGKAGKSGIAEIELSDIEQDKFGHRFHRVRNNFFGGRLIYQKGVISTIRKHKWDAVILLGDANILSNWLAGILARIKRVPLFFWGHGMYGNERGLKRLFRKSFLSLANYHFVYGNWGRQQMVKAGMDEQNIFVIYNSLDYNKARSLREKAVEPDYYKKTTIFDNNKPVLIFIGRLTRIKRLHLLIEAASELRDRDLECNLLIIGSGTEEDALKKLAEEKKIEAHFYGSCYEEQINAKLLANADLCVSPGNVGLTAVHALSFGTPVCTHNDFANQMPEFEAIEEGETGCFFDADKLNIAETIESWLSNKTDRTSVRKKCYKVIDQKYNPDYQLHVLKKALKKVTE